MKLFVLLLAAGVTAQSTTTERKEKTKIEVEGGKTVAVTGCVQRVVETPGYVLTDDFGKVQYALVTEDDLAKYVERRVEVKGTAADRDGKVKIERKVEGTTGEKSTSKIETKGDMADMPFLGVKSIKRIAGSCR